MEEGGPAKFLGRRKEPNQHADTGWACVRWALAGGASGSAGAFGFLGCPLTSPSLSTVEPLSVCPWSWTRYRQELKNEGIKGSRFTTIHDAFCSLLAVQLARR